MLQARHATPGAIAGFAATFSARGAVRVERALTEHVVAGTLETLKTQPHTPVAHVDPEQGFLLWRFAWRPEAECDHLTCRLGRWAAGEGRAWASAVTGLPLWTDGVLVSDEHAKGSHAELHDEAGGGRAVVLQLGVTPAPWPAEWGGHFERVGPDGAVVDRLAPGWNTLDLYDVRTPGSGRRVPLLTRHVVGYTVTASYSVVAGSS